MQSDFEAWCTDVSRISLLGMHVVHKLGHGPGAVTGRVTMVRHREKRATEEVTTDGLLVQADNEVQDGFPWLWFPASVHGKASKRSFKLGGNGTHSSRASLK